MSNATAPLAIGTVVELAVHPRLAAARAKRDVIIVPTRYTIAGSNPIADEFGGGYRYLLANSAGKQVLGGVGRDSLIVIDDSTRSDAEIPAGEIATGDTIHDQNGFARKVTHVRTTGHVEDGTFYLAVYLSRGRKSQPLLFKSTDVVRVWR